MSTPEPWETATIALASADAAVNAARYRLAFALQDHAVSFPGPEHRALAVSFPGPEHRALAVAFIAAVDAAAVAKAAYDAAVLR